MHVYGTRYKYLEGIVKMRFIKPYPSHWIPVILQCDLIFLSLVWQCNLLTLLGWPHSSDIKKKDLLYRDKEYRYVYFHKAEMPLEGHLHVCVSMAGNGQQSLSFLMQGFLLTCLQTILYWQMFKTIYIDRCSESFTLTCVDKSFTLTDVHNPFTLTGIQKP